MREFDKSLLETGAQFKAGHAAIAANLCKAVAAITALVAVLVTFTDVTFASLAAKEITTALTVLLMSAYIIYFSLEEAGERQGEECEDYKAARERHTALCERITPEMIPALRDFAEKYSIAEAEHRRRTELMRLGYSEEEFLAYKRGERTGRRAARELRRVKRITPMPLGAATLLSKEKSKSKSELYDPDRSKHLKLALKLIPTTLCMLVTVSIVLSTKSDLGVSEVCEGIMKLSTLPIVGIRGYLAGLSYSKETKTAWLTTRSRLLETFLKECSED